MRIVMSILAWLLSLAFLGLAALLAGVGAAMFPDYEQGGAYDVLQRTMRVWPFVAAGAAALAALVVNPFTAARFGLGGKWGRATAGVAVALAGVAGALFMDEREFRGALEQYEKRIVEIENRHEARMKACGLFNPRNISTDPHMAGRGLGDGEVSGKVGGVTYAADAAYDNAGRSIERESVYRACISGPSGESVVLTDEMIRNSAGGPITVTVGGSRIAVTASDIRAALETARKAAADQRQATTLWTRCTYAIDTVDHQGRVIRPADAVSPDSGFATCLE